MKRFLLLALGLMLTAASCSFLGGSGSKGVLKSTDGGETFTPSNALAKKGEIGGLTANSFTMDPSDSDVMYLGSSSGIHKTTDGAKTWTHVLGNMRIGDVEVDPSSSDIVYAAGITGENGRIIKSTDGGQTWKDIYTEPTKNNPAMSVAISKANSRVILAGLGSGEVIRSTDEGVTWALVRDLADSIVKMDYTDNAMAYLLTQNTGLYVSQDQGSNWTPVTVTVQTEAGPGTAIQQRLTSRTFYDAAFDRRIDGVVFLATEQGLLRTLDAGATWAMMSLPVTNETLKVSAVAINPTNSNNLVITIGSTFLRTTNGGVTWETRKLPTQQKVRHILVDPDEPNSIYLGMGDR